MKKQFIASAIIVLISITSGFGAIVTFSPTQPAVGSDDVAALVGSLTDRDNVGTASTDGGANDAATYVAFDRPAQGQTFMTPSDFPLYRLTAVTVRHVGYSGSNPGGASGSNTWYSTPAGNAFTIRVTDPSQAGTTGFVLSAETYTITGAEANLLAPGGVTNTPDGTGTWITFTLDAPVLLVPAALYGFDVASGPSAFFETHGIKDTASGGNPYAPGSAYTSGASGVGSNALNAAPGDRVFIVHLVPAIPDNGDLSGNGKVDLEDIAILSADWQGLYDLSTLSTVVANWLFVEPPLFTADPILKSDALENEPYSGSLAGDIAYCDPSLLAFSKTAGPAWLTVAADGALSGAPAAADVGLNTFTVRADDGVNPPAEAALQITVTAAPVPFDMLRAVPFTDVTFTDNFWLPRLQTNREVTVPYIFDRLEGVYNAANNRVDNFAIAGGLMTGTPRYDFPFDDTDIYKTLEGAAYSLMVSPDPALDQYLDGLIVKIAAAQANNGFFPGYLYTIRTNGVDIWCGPAPWTNLASSHELYNAGHLIEAAIAHHQATGKTSLLNVATAFADLLVDTFHDGGIEIPPGHEVVETALARLYDVTGDPDHLALARYFLDIRGTVTDDYRPWGTYHQDHLPVLQQTEAVGHVVRAVYLYMGMADVAVRTDDAAYRDALMAALDSIWHSVNDTKAYITGGLGASHGGEAFGAPYELPHDGYCETCAQIANVMWNHRMFLCYRDAKYIDVLERTLYNSVTSGVSLKGDTFFYPNPLVSNGGYARSPWFSCNCCLGNIARTIPSIPGYVYCHDDDELYVNLYVAGTATTQVAATAVTLTQAGSYPWDGNMTLTVNPAQPADFTVRLRIPGWAQNQPVPGDLYAYRTQSAAPVTIDVNGAPVPLTLDKGYVAITRTWQPGDTIHLSLPMPVRQVKAHPNVAACVGQVALERGPIVYCAEWPDFAAGRFSHLYVPETAALTPEYRDNMLGDPTIVNKGNVINGAVKGVYETETGSIVEQDEPFTAIPYYAWAHRGTGPMAVWLADTAAGATPVPQPTPEELIGHWTLDEAAGATAADSSGKDMHGALMNGLSFSSASVAGPVGSALAFDGGDDYIDLPDGFSDFAKGCTVSVWVRPTAVRNWARFIDFGNGASSDNIWFGREGSTNNLVFECFSGGSNAGRVLAPGAIVQDEWQLMTATVDAFGSGRLYRNGQLVATGTTKPTSVTRTRNYVGRSNWSADAYYAGSLDDLRLYNYPLDAAEVAALYTAP